MSSFSSSDVRPRNRRALAASALAVLLPLSLAFAPPALRAEAARIPPHVAPYASAARPAAAAVATVSPWRALAALWRRLTATADSAGDPGTLPTDDNGGVIDPNGHPKPAAPHP